MNKKSSCISRFTQVGLAGIVLPSDTSPGVKDVRQHALNFLQSGLPREALIRIQRSMYPVTLVCFFYKGGELQALIRTRMPAVGECTYYILSHLVQDIIHMMMESTHSRESVWRNC